MLKKSAKCKIYTVKSLFDWLLVYLVILIKYADLIDRRRPDDLAGDDEERWRTSVYLFLSGVFIVNLRNFLLTDVTENLLLDLAYWRVSDMLIGKTSQYRTC